MTPVSPAFRARLIFGAAAIAFVLSLAGLLPLDGTAHGGLARAAGRFHPLLVHFPIVLLLLVPLLERAGRWRPALREAAGYLLGLAVPSVVLAVADGWLLARAEGHEGALVTAHARGGIFLALGTVITWLVRGHSRFGYALSLAATLGCLFWAAHNGGSLTHGADYLTEALPTPVKRALRLPEPPPPDVLVPGSVFAVAVRPILEQHCLPCHGPDKQKGDYRLDHFAALVAGGKSGVDAIVPGDLLHSELVRRLGLEPDDEKLMPPRKKPRLAPADVALLRWWVKQGAPQDLTVAAALSQTLPPEIARRLAPGPAPTAASEADQYVPVVGDYGHLATEIRRLETSLGIQLVPVSKRAGDGLILRTLGVADRFDDAALTQFATVAPFIVEAELAGTKLTDAGLVALKPFTHLARLHLERTAIRGRTLQALQTLSALRYLNLCFTEVSDDTLEPLAHQAALERLYLFGSQVTPGGIAHLRSSLPQCHFGPLGTDGSTGSTDEVPAK